MSEKRLDYLCTRNRHAMPEGEIRELQIEARRAREREQRNADERDYWRGRAASEGHGADAKDAEIAMLRSVYQEHLNGVTVWDWKARADKAEAEIAALRQRIVKMDVRPLLDGLTDNLALRTEEAIEREKRITQLLARADKAEAERDEAREKVAGLIREHDRDCALINRYAEKFETEKADNARLREAIENAPHYAGTEDNDWDDGCHVHGYDYSSVEGQPAWCHRPPCPGCTCWKAAALKEEK